MAWKFLDYLDARGTNPIRAWLDDLDDRKAAKKIDAIIRYLAARTRLEPPLVMPITGYAGIFEIKLIRQGIQYRPLGCYGPDRWEFALLIGATEQGNRIRPTGAFDRALERKAIIETDRRRIGDHDFGSTATDHQQPAD